MRSFCKLGGKIHKKHSLLAKSLLLGDFSIEMLIRILTLAIAILSTRLLSAQVWKDCADSLKFIDFEKNKIEVFDSTQWTFFQKKLCSCAESDTAKVSIVHIGDSHLQADFLSGELRRCLHREFNHSRPSRGLIFPYTVAGTNNPSNYKIGYTGDWTNSKCIDRQCENIGISGITVTTSDTTSTLYICIADNEPPGYGGSRIQLFTDLNKLGLWPILYGDTATNRLAKIDVESQSIIWELDTIVDSIAFTFNKMPIQGKRIKSKGDSFILQGLSLTTGKGIEYHTIGVNGARVSSYLKCEKFIPQLKSLNPDLVIISLGTNDSYGQNFNSEKFENQLAKLIESIQKEGICNNILLTTPGNDKINRELYNQNAHICAETIAKVGKQMKCAIWDFNAIMGNGENVDVWFESGLMRSDYLHFTKEGYELQAHLLFNAMLNGCSIKSQF